MNGRNSANSTDKDGRYWGLHGGGRGGQQRRGDEEVDEARCIRVRIKKPLKLYGSLGGWGMTWRAVCI